MSTTEQPPADRAPRRRFGPLRTLRGRLIAGVLALLVLACALIALSSTLVVRHTLIAKVDDGLVAASQRTNDHGGPGGGRPGPQPGDDQTPGPGQGAGTLEASISGGAVVAGWVVAESGSTQPLSSADQAVLLGVPADGQPHTVSLPGTGPYRVLASPVSGAVTLITGLPLADVNATLRTQLSVELAVFGAVIVLTGLAGAALVRLSLRPLDRVAATARAVSAVPLAAGQVELRPRVPSPDPDTEVGQVGVAFNLMLDHVDSALQQRQASEDRLRQFVADASHELRTPLAAIRGHAELARRVREPLPAHVDHALTRVESESRRMGVLVDDLLLLARLDSGRPLARDPVDLTRLTIEVTSDARAASPDRTWRLDLPSEPILVPGDDLRLHQVLGNLLTNARTHTPLGTVVIVRLLAPPAPGGPAVLEVADDGPGIPPEVLPRVFERFVRADTSRSRTAGSTGLGLSIVAAVVHAHGGIVGVTSGPNGTTFRIELPGAVLAAGTEEELVTDADSTEEHEGGGAFADVDSDGRAGAGAAVPERASVAPAGEGSTDHA